VADFSALPTDWRTESAKGIVNASRALFRRRRLSDVACSARVRGENGRGKLCILHHVERQDKGAVTEKSQPSETKVQLCRAAAAPTHTQGRGSIVVIFEHHGLPPPPPSWLETAQFK
jgi:hypothetical protein